ncbi:MAG TPA: type I restriction enzyme HsdR N-terminal domain-containing protein [Phnomibacter sp.]|nr:type I restriction enzyme HsdR N-terminal domain-containing protein [Phnomibacter sp.]
MLQVQFPEHDFRTRPTNGGTEIFDTIRKKWILLTPEEWVRQNMIHWLHEVHKVPIALIAVERLLIVGESRRRFDIVVYTKQHTPWLLVECKSMDVQLNEAVLQQALSYYSAMPTALLMVTNGHHTYAWQQSNFQLEMLQTLPVFPA